MFCWLLLFRLIYHSNIRSFDWCFWFLTILWPLNFVFRCRFDCFHFCLLFEMIKIHTNVRITDNNQRLMRNVYVHIHSIKRMLSHHSILPSYDLSFSIHIIRNAYSTSYLIIIYKEYWDDRTFSFYSRLYFCFPPHKFHSDWKRKSCPHLPSSKRSNRKVFGLFF